MIAIFKFNHFLYIIVEVFTYIMVEEYVAFNFSLS